MAHGKHIKMFELSKWTILRNSLSHFEFDGSSKSWDNNQKTASLGRDTRNRSVI